MPTLDRALIAFDRWWAGRSTRERQAVSVLAVILAVAVLIFLIIKPLQAARADALADIRLYETLNARMLAAGRLDPTQAQPTLPPDQLLQQAAGQIGASVAPSGDQFVLTMTDADYGQLIAQLSTVTGQAGLSVVRADLVRTSSPGRVSGTVELAK
ncbi:type II secretion system protein GspM [Sphingomonas sp. CJ99]